MSMNFKPQPKQPVIGPTPQTIAKPPLRLFTAANILMLFTAQAIAFIWLDYLGVKPYPQHYTPIYFAVLAGVSASNLLRRSRWFM